MHSDSNYLELLKCSTYQWDAGLLIFRSISWHFICRPFTARPCARPHSVDGMARRRDMIDYGLLKKSLKNLEERNQYRKSLQPDQTRQIIESVAESTIQRFEICYDCLWKVLKRHLEEKIGLAKVPTGPRPLARMAFENALIVNGEQWIKYINARNNTAHDYDARKAEDCLQIIDQFISDAITLYQTMTGEKWA